MIKRMFGTTFELLRSGQWRSLRSTAARHWNSETKAVGLARDLAVPFEAPSAKIPITIRPLRADDVEPLLKVGENGLSVNADNVRAQRRRLLGMDLSTCYVAATEDDEPCFMQWLVGPEENDRLQEAFGGRLPLLRPGEMMLEGMFTPDRWHGRRIAPAAMARITELAAERNARKVLVFVLDDNVAALRASVKAGFKPYTEATYRWRRFRLHIDFSPIPDRSASVVDREEGSRG